MNDNPYRPTANAGTVSDDEDNYTFKSLTFLSKAIAVCLVFFCVFRVSETFIATFALLSASGVSETDVIGANDAEIQFDAPSVGAIATGLLAIIAFFCNMIMVPIFSYRSNANLRALGSNELDHGAEVASVYWFVPILNLFKPYQTTKEVFDESRALLPHNDSQTNPIEQTAPTNIVGMWWACWIVGNITKNIVRRLSRGDAPLESAYLLLYWISTIALCVAAIFLINIVITTANNQERIAERLRPI